jgi:hypothetical protein
VAAVTVTVVAVLVVAAATATAGRAAIVADRIPRRQGGGEERREISWIRTQKISPPP